MPSASTMKRAMVSRGNDGDCSSINNDENAEYCIIADNGDVGFGDDDAADGDDYRDDHDRDRDVDADDHDYDGYDDRDENQIVDENNDDDGDDNGCEYFYGDDEEEDNDDD